jgi:hypothetical protein
MVLSRDEIRRSSCPPASWNVCRSCGSAVAPSRLPRRDVRGRLPRQPRFHVVYHLVSTDIPLTMRVKVILGRGGSADDIDCVVVGELAGTRSVGTVRRRSPAIRSRTVADA